LFRPISGCHGSKMGAGIAAVPPSPAPLASVAGAPDRRQGNGVHHASPTDRHTGNRTSGHARLGVLEACQALTGCPHAQRVGETRSRFFISSHVIDGDRSHTVAIRDNIERLR
jgi:hypothetical protein